MRRCNPFAIVCFVAIAAISPCRAAEPFPVVVVTDTLGMNDQYCGLYCVHQAGRLSGRNVDLDRLIQPSRMHGEFGSTTADLVECCREFQIACRPIAYASYADICILGGPVIVLVKNAPEASRANHWIMVLSARPDSAEVYDPSSGVFRLSAAELQSIWGGPAILILKSSDGPEVEIVWVVLKIGLICFTLGSALLVVRTLARTHWHPAFVLVAATLILAGVAHYRRSCRVRQQSWGRRTDRCGVSPTHPYDCRSCGRSRKRFGVRVGRCADATPVSFRSPSRCNEHSDYLVALAERATVEGHPFRFANCLVLQFQRLFVGRFAGEIGAFPPLRIGRRPRSRREGLRRSRREVVARSPITHIEDSHDNPRQQPADPFAKCIVAQRACALRHARSGGDVIDLGTCASLQWLSVTP